MGKSGKMEILCRMVENLENWEIWSNQPKMRKSGQIGIFGEKVENPEIWGFQ